MRYGILALVLAGVTGVAWAEPTKEELQQRVAALEAENAKLRKQVAAMEAQIESLREDVVERERQAAIAQAQAEEATAAERARFVERSEPDDDGRTSLRTRPIKLEVTHGSRAAHYVQIIAPPSGEGALVMKLNGYGTGRSYDHLDTVTFVVDGEEMALPITSYDRDRRVTGSRKARVDRSNEMLELRLSVAELEKLAGANAISGHVGPTRFVGGRDLMSAAGVLQEAIEGAGSSGD